MPEEVLAENGKSWSDLDALGVCVGPGNFTGVRISVASARGLSLSLGIPAVGVSKLEAMALGTKGRVTSALDARRDRVYVQTFQNSAPVSAPQMAALLDIYDQLEESEVLRVSSDEELAISKEQPVSEVDNLVVAVGRITVRRYDQDLPRPAPLYLRAADAAPPSDTPVVILP